MQTLARDEKESKSTPTHRERNGLGNQVSLHASLKQNYSGEIEDKLNKTWGPLKNYETPQPEQKAKQVSIMSKIKNWATNLNYSFLNQSHTTNETLIMTLLGEVFLAEQEDLMKKRISETLWFSYREKIPKIMEETFGKGAYTCDRGWGCMLRCGQMLMAEAVKRHLNDAESLKKGLNEEAYLDIILFFADGIKNPEVSPFSIHQICSKAYEYFELKPGEWFKPSNIMVTLAKLNDQHRHYRLTNFRTCIFVDGTVFEDQIAQKVFNEDNQNNPPKHEKPEKPEEEKTEPPSQEEEKKNSDEVKNNEENQAPIDLNKKWDNSLLMFIATKTGLDTHNELYLHTVLKLLSFRNSIGMLGGKGSRAHYFLGFQNSTLLYFDPHYVQDASPDIQSLGQDYNTYFLKKCFQINIKDIDTSVGFGFYIRNEIEYAQFKEDLQTAMKDDPNFLIGFEETTPPVDLEPEDVIVCKEDDSFEVIM